MSSIQKTNTGNPEWMTPSGIIQTARNIMGSIDCDPATFTKAQKLINATIYYTATNNGAGDNSPWLGNVWLNPPYYTGSKKKPGINAFSRKLISEIGKGHTTQAIFLAQSKTETYWFRRLFKQANCVMFTNRRIKFIDEHGIEGGNPGYGSVLFYFGTRTRAFHNHYSDIAYIVK